MKNRPNNESLGEVVRSRRTSLGMSLDQAASASTLHKSYWSKLEAGQYQTPAPRYLQIIGRTLDMPIEELYAMCGYEIPERLPSFTGYMRATTSLPPEAIRQLEVYMTFLRHQFGIPEDQPVFPPKPRADEQAPDEVPTDDRSAA